MKVALALLALATLLAAGCGRSGPPEGRNLPPGFLRVEYPLGLGVVSSLPPGISCGSNLTSCEFQFPPGASVALSATNDPAVPFALWGGDCASANSAPLCELTLDQGKLVGADFLHRLTVAVTGTGSVASIDSQIQCNATGGVCQTFYAPTQSEVRLDATTGGRAVAWQGDCTPQDDPAVCLTDGMSAPREVAARLLDRGETVWAIGIGSDGDDRGHGIAIDAAGNAVVTGEFSGDIDLGGGALTPQSRAGFVASFEKEDGAHRWSGPIDGDGDDRGWAVAATSGGGISLAGEHSSAALDFFGQGTATGPGNVDGWFVSVTGTSGAFREHVDTSRGDDDYFYGVSGDPSGSIWCAGLLNLDGGNAYVRRINPAGVVTALEIGNGGADTFFAVAATASGDAGLAGYMTSANVTLLGLNLPLSSNGGTDIFFVRTPAALGADLTIARRYGAGSDDAAFGIAMDPTGSAFYLTGYIAGTDPIAFDSKNAQGSGAEDLFVSKHDATTGETVWVQTFGSTGNEVGYGIAVAADGVAVVGTFDGSTSFGGVAFSGFGGLDILVAKLRTDNGEVIWARELGSDQDDYATAVAVDADGWLSVTGVIGAPTDFGLGPVDHASGNDVFVMRLAP